MNDGSRVSVPSPCRDVCQLDSAGICVGCGRSIQEIAEWPGADNDRRLLIRAEARRRIDLESEAAQRRELVDRGPR